MRNVDELYTRWGALGDATDSAFEDWRRLSLDVLDVLVAEQAAVISLLAWAFEPPGPDAVVDELRQLADAGLERVRQLSRMHWALQAVIAAHRNARTDLAA